MNIVNANAKIAKFSKCKLGLQNEHREELKQIDELSSKLNEHTLKIREYDPYKADLIQDNFNKWKENKIETLNVLCDSAIFKLEKKMQVLQTGIVYTNDLTGLEEAYKIELNKLNQQERDEKQTSIHQKNIRNLNENEQRYYFLIQQYQNIKIEFINQKIALKNKYTKLISETNDKNQRVHIKNKYRNEKASVVKQYYQRIDVLNEELRQAKIIVKTNSASQRKLVLRQVYLTKISSAKREYQNAVKSFHIQNKRVQKSYRTSIAKLQAEFAHDPHRQRLSSVIRGYQIQINRQKGVNLSLYHKQLAQIRSITKTYLDDKRKLNGVYNEYKRDLRSKNNERSNRLRLYRKQYRINVASIRKAYIRHKKAAIANKSNANVIKHLRTQCNNQLANAKQRYVRLVKNVNPVPTKDFNPAYRNLFKTYQLSIKDVRNKIAHQKRLGLNKVKTIISTRNETINRINKEKENKFNVTPASRHHHDRSISKIRTNYLHELSINRARFNDLINNCKKTIRETANNQNHSSKELKTNLAHLKSRYQKQVDSFNMEIRNSKIPTDRDLQKIDDLKTNYASEVKEIHKQYFQQHELSKKNIKVITNQTRQELKHVAADKRHASAVSFAFESKYIRANHKQKIKHAQKLLSQNIAKIQSNDRLSKRSIKDLYRKHLNFINLHRAIHFGTLKTHYDSKQVHDRLLRILNNIRKNAAAKISDLNKKNIIATKDTSRLINSVNNTIKAKRTAMSHNIHEVIVNGNHQVNSLIKSKKTLRVDYSNERKHKFAAFVSAKNEAVKSNNYQHAKHLKTQWKITKNALAKEFVNKIKTINGHIYQAKLDTRNKIKQIHKHFDLWHLSKIELIKSYHEKLNALHKTNSTLIKNLKTKRNEDIREAFKKYRDSRATYIKQKQEFNKKTEAIRHVHREKLIAENKKYLIARKTLSSDAIKEHNNEMKIARDHYHRAIIAINHEYETKLTTLHKERNERKHLYANRISLLKNKSTNAISDVRNSLTKLHKDTLTKLNELERNYHSMLVKLQHQVEVDRKARTISVHAQMERYQSLKSKYHSDFGLQISKFEKRQTLNKQIISQEKHKLIAYAKMYHEKTKLLQDNYLMQVNKIRANHYSASVAPRVEHLKKVALAREQLKLALKTNVEKYLIARNKYQVTLANEKETLDKENAHITAHSIRPERIKTISHRDALAKLRTKYDMLIENLKVSCEKKKRSLLRLKTINKSQYYDQLHYTLNQFAIKYDQLCSNYYKEKTILNNKHKFWMNPHKLIRVDFDYRRQSLSRRFIELINKAKLKYNTNMKLACETRVFLTPAQKYKIHVRELRNIYDNAVSRAKKQLEATIKYYNKQNNNDYLTYKNKRKHLIEQKKYNEVEALKFQYKNNKYTKHRAALVAIKYATEVYNDKVAQAKLAYVSALRGAKASEVIRLRNEHALPMFERLYANVIRGQKRLAEAELTRLEIMKEDKKLRKVFTNLPLWVSTYIKFAIITSILWVFLFTVFQLLYFLVGGDAFSMFAWTNGNSHLSIFGMTSIIALVITVSLSLSAFVLYMLECKSKRHVETKLRLDNIQILEKTNQQLNNEYKKLYQFTKTAQIQNSDLAEKMYDNTKNTFQHKLDSEINILKSNNNAFNKQLNNQFIHHNKYIVKTKDMQIATQDALYTSSLDKHVHSFNTNLHAQAREANAVLLNKQHEFRHKIRQLVSLQQQEINFKQAEIQALELAQLRETQKYKQAIKDLVNLQNQELYLKQIEYTKNLASNHKRIENILTTNKKIYARNRQLINEITTLRKEVVKTKAHADSLAARLRTEQKVEKLKGLDKKKAKQVAREQKVAYKRMLKQKRVNARMAKKQARKVQKQNKK